MKEKKSKILVIVDGIGPKRARGSDIIYLIQERLVKMGIDMHILTLIDFGTRKNWKQWMKNKEGVFGIKFHYLNIPPLKRFPRTYVIFFKIYSFFAILFLYYKYQFDIIHEYSSDPILFYKTALTRPFVGRNVKLYQTLCTSNDPGLNRTPIKWIKYLSIDKIICHSRETTDALIKKGCSPQKVVYLPIGIESEKFNNVQDFGPNEYNLPENKKKILYIGPIDDRKGIYLLADVIPKVIQNNPDVFFIFVCSKTNSDKKYTKNKKNLLDKMAECENNFLLIEGIADVAYFLAISDIFIYPLKNPYGTLSIPLTLLEAMASGRAVVASAVGGNKEVIKDGANGLLFGINDKSQLSELILKLLKDEEYVRKLGAEARETIQKYFNIEINSKKLYNLYYGI